MKVYTLSKTLFITFICIALLAGCNGTAINSLKPEATVQGVSAPSQQPAIPARLSFYDNPEGNSRVMRYGQYIYYLSGNMGINGSKLCRMHEDGTDPETLLPAENVSGFQTPGGKLYITGTIASDDESNHILQRIEPDGNITEVMKYQYGLFRVLEDELYFTSYDPIKGMELAEEQERQWIDLSGSGEGFIAKWIGNNVYKIDGYLYYTYSIADVPGKRYHQALVKALPDGTGEKTLDEGQLPGGLFKCGGYLVYGKGERFPGQIWAYDTGDGTKKLLFDIADVQNASNTLEIVGAKDGWVYFKFRYKDSGHMLYRIKPDDPESIETVWDWYQTRGELLQVDLENGWIYYGIFVRVPEEEQYLNANDCDYILRSHRCGLDGSNDIRFSDRTAHDPVTVGGYIYFESADNEMMNITFNRYNTVTGELEEMPNGFVRKVHMGGIK